MRAFDKKKGENPSTTTFFSPKIQTKLQTGTPGDRYEVEADKVADQVVNKPKGGLLQSKSDEIQQKPLAETISMVQKQDMKEEETVQKKTEEKEEKIQKKEEEKETVQAKCKNCEEEGKVQKKSKEEEKPVQTKSDASQPTTSSSSLETTLNRSKGSGQKMEKSTQNEMESGFGTNFSNVTIHTDSNAVQMSEELGAHAFTHGNDVYFNNGKYNPNTKEGKHLLAHELTHTVQQTGMIQKSAIENHPENLQNPENPFFKNNPPLEKANDNEMLITTGHKGGYVEELQTGLLEWRQDSLPKYGADGDFGSETKNAVLNFQIEKNLKGKDGIVGPETMGTLDNVVLEKKGGKKEKPNCFDPESNLPKMFNPFDIHDSVLSTGEFLSLGSFKIRSTANWKKAHPAKHYQISVIEFIPGTMNSNVFRRRFDIGKNETQTFTFPKNKCVSFKVLIKVINPTKTSPNLVGNFSVFH